MTNETTDEILDTTPEIVAAMEAVNAAVENIQKVTAEAERAYSETLLVLKEAGGNTTFKCAGKILQVRTRVNKETGERFAFLVELETMPSEWRKNALDRKVAEALADIQAGKRSAPEVTVEKVSSEEQVFAATGTDDISIEVE